MTKATVAKKLKKSPTTEGDMSEYDPVIFEVRDRHYHSLFAVKKKIRACEKKIRELEQSLPSSQRPNAEANAASTKKGAINTAENDKATNERLSKIEHKKMQLSIWKEAALCIHGARKEEMAQGVTNLSLADVIDGIELLKQVLENEDKWAHYKCPNKKHLQKPEIERIRQLAHYLNVDGAAEARVGSLNAPSKSGQFCSFSSVVDYLSSPIAIGQNCPMSFSEFVPLFDKLRKTLLVEIVVKEPVVEPESTTAVVANVDKEADSAPPLEKMEGIANGGGDKAENPKNNKPRTKRSPKGPKPNRKPQNGTASSSTANNVATTQSSLPSIPEKLVVVVTSNAKSKHPEGLTHSTIATPTSTSAEEVSKPNPASAHHHSSKPPKAETVSSSSKQNVPSGRFIQHPNVPIEDSDEEGWFSPAGLKPKKVAVGSNNNYRNQTQNSSSRRGGGSGVGSNKNGPRNVDTRATGAGANSGYNKRRGSNNPPTSTSRDPQHNNGANSYRNKRPQPMNKPANPAAVIQAEGEW